MSTAHLLAAHAAISGAVKVALEAGHGAAIGVCRQAQRTLGYYLRNLQEDEKTVSADAISAACMIAGVRKSHARLSAEFYGVTVTSPPLELA